jgi:dolichol-phosphate mannosyltransferase
MTGLRTLVVIPARNEGATIETVVRRALRHAPVCVVDDGSTHDTPAILARLEGVQVIRHEKGGNYAAAILDGMRHALAGGYEYVVTMDAGLSHDPDELPRFLGAGEADFVIGVRNGADKWDVPLHRRVLSKTGTVLMRHALRRLGGPGRERWHDCTSGYRRYSRAALALLTTTPLRGRAYDFILETVALVAWSGVSVSEVPISYRHTNSAFRLPLVWNALRMWWTLCYRHHSFLDWPVDPETRNRRAARGERDGVAPQQPG